MRSCSLFGLLLFVFLAGCSSAPPASQTKDGSGDSSAGPPAEFSLAWSEYPSWSVFGVAHELGLLDGTAGKQGEIEKKWNVDIVLHEASYDSCLQMFANGNCDAVCITNMDALIVSPNRDGIAILPTSTSNGADACIVVGIEDLSQLQQETTYGLENSVSQYCFVRCLEKQSQDPNKFRFSNQDPGAAAVAMQQNQETHRAIMVWNPFLLQTLNKRPDSKVLFDSSLIPGEIVDMVVVGRDIISRPGAKEFSQAVIETFYRMNEVLAAPGTGDEALKALGEKFSDLGLDDMRKVVQQTQFYKTPDEAISLITSDAFAQTMETVAQFCKQYKILESPEYGIGQQGSTKLRFDASYIESWKGSAK